MKVSRAKARKKKGGGNMMDETMRQRVISQLSLREVVEVAEEVKKTGDWSKVTWIHENVWGDVSEIQGDVSGIRGNVSGVWGNVSEIYEILKARSSAPA